MNKSPQKSNRQFRLMFVLGGFLFVMTILILAKVIGDGPIVPAIFIIGWIVLALFLVRFVVVHMRSKSD